MNIPATRNNPKYHYYPPTRKEPKELLDRVFSRIDDDITINKLMAKATANPKYEKQLRQYLEFIELLQSHGLLGKIKLIEKLLQKNHQELLKKTKALEEFKKSGVLTEKAFREEVTLLEKTQNGRLFKELRERGLLPVKKNGKHR